jgi:predicted RNase H-like nuclease
MYYKKTIQRYRRKILAGDDLLDAMVLAGFTSLSVENGLYTLPAEVEYDECNIPMAIHYSVLSS